MNTMMKTSLTLVVGLIACEPVGLYCTDMGCVGQMVIHLPMDALMDAEYVLRLEYGDVVERCTFTLPFTGDSVQCEQGATLTLEEGAVTLRQDLYMGENFDTLFVELFEQDLNRLSETVDIDWSEPFYPNGEECDGDYGCRNTTIDLVVQ